MNQIVCKLNPDDKFSVPESLFEVNLSDKEGYHYTFFKLFRRLYQIPKAFDNEAIDLFYISLMVFYADRKIKRAKSNDAWTRDFKLYVPVLELDKWEHNKLLLENMISYLSGDIWKFEFRARQLNELEKKVKKGIEASKKKFTPDSFCMLSGGLDSFIGAIDLLNENKNIAFVGHYSGGKGVKIYQDCIIQKLTEQYELKHEQFFNFFAAPIKGTEDTTRTRSFMFFAHATILASGLNKATNLFIPENGLISLNIPLTNTRIGSSSTRTTHPYYMGLLQELISNLGLQITLKNPYQFFTKGEMIQNCKNQTFLKANIEHTMSCSHPDQGRYLKETKPSHCGTCLPCVIRRASIEKAYNIDNSAYRDKDFKTGKAVYELNSYKIGILDYKRRSRDKSFIIQNSGPISTNLDNFCALYERGMDELIQLIDKYNG